MARDKRKNGDSIMRKDNESYSTCAEKRQANEKKEIFDLIKKDLTNLEIADIAGISYTEVLSYRIAYEKRSR